MELIANIKSFDGEQRRYRHASNTLKCDMVFSVYVPPQAKGGPVPVLYWLSGLTCDDQNFVTKAGAQRYAAEHGVAIVAPDTSPRGDDVPDDEDGAWDFGKGAGFYVNATQSPWATHYQMYDYVVGELSALVNEHCPVDASRESIFGHSMGGHGALIIGLKNSDRFRSISAFSPICAPSKCPWGQKALGRYLGEDKASWAAWDATQLIASASERPIMIDQGGADEFLEAELKPEALLEAAPFAVQYRLHEGYDHSYYFISTFIGEHIAFHAKHLA